ncbi:MAG: UvrD-helicase domain-containing protein [Planctomycetes bacterium]|nr:UvrD-helicase domain-containing protein [Planctomycetota bacterium]
MMLNSKSTSAPDPLLDPLNPPQRQAVLHAEGPLLILAGAGSGKTRVITHRIAYLVRRGVRPESILAITFTNKAAGEMRRRVEKLLGVEPPWVSTFHSFAARLLRRHLDRVPPYTRDFTIYDEDDSFNLLKSCLEETGVDRGLIPLRSLREEISQIKNRGILEADALPPASDLRSRILRQVYGRYREALEERNAVDFDDLLLLLLKLLETQPDLLERYRRQFRYVLIDEFQDTNRVQYLISHRIAEPHRNLCVTGDPDQSIYSWRGADLQNMLNFEKDYPETAVVKLEQNYRSTGNILETANQVIQFNRQRREKVLWTENGAGEPVEVHCFSSAEEEAREIAELVEELEREGVRGSDIAIFYRTNNLSREIERALVAFNIPYTIVGAIEFYERKEVKDLVAFLRLLVNRRDTESFRRVINLPPRGIGKATLEKLFQAAAQAGVAPLMAALDPALRARAARGRALAGLEAFCSLYQALAGRLDQPVSRLLELLIEQLGYEAYLLSSGLDHLEDRLANLAELVSAAAQYEERQPEGSAGGFLEEISLLAAVDRWEEKRDRVTLMTLHSAKGLEFPVVIIAGLEEGTLPLIRKNTEDRTDREEERRLFYVGVTRAQRQLYLTHARSRLQYGSRFSSSPSSFLKELLSSGPACWLRVDDLTREALAEEEARAGSWDLEWDASGPRRRYSPGGGRTEKDGPEKDGSEKEWAEEDWPDEDPGEDPFPPGCRVYHDTYGEGIVLQASGLGRRRRLTIDFESVGEKRLVLGFARLRRI